MKTRFTPLVKIKKNAMDKCENELSIANKNVQKAEESLNLAYEELQHTSTPQSGTISLMLQAKSLQEAQRHLIEDKKSWLTFAKEQYMSAKNVLKDASMEYEKFKYLELEEIKKHLKKLAQLEAKDMDEVALMGYMRKKGKL